MGRPKKTANQRAADAIERIAAKQPNGFALTDIPKYTELGTTALRKLLDEAVKARGLKVIGKRENPRKNGLPILVYAATGAAPAQAQGGDEHVEAELDPRAYELSTILTSIGSIDEQVEAARQLQAERIALVARRNELLDAMREEGEGASAELTPADAEATPPRISNVKKGKFGKPNKKAAEKKIAAGKKKAAHARNHAESPRAEAAA